MRIRLLPLFFAGILISGCNSSKEIAPPQTNSKWIARIVEYRPAPGQFINTGQGNAAAAQKLIGGQNTLVSLGGFGGYIIFEFDHEVRNIDGPDFVIHGNAFTGSSEPGIVMVSPDGRSWYELKGSEYDHPESVRNYSVTYTAPSQTVSAEAIRWADNQGGEGEIPLIPDRHRQCYWPLFFDDTPQTLTYSGTRLPGNITIENQEYVLNAFSWGYVDNYSADYTQIVGGDKETRDSNKFDISNAVDAAGNPVELTSIRQIKVYTAQNQHAGPGVGETSTEISGAISLSANLR